MNHAHLTHYTLDPDPRIRHVLHGWAENGRVPAFDLTIEDMHVTNLPTNIRTLDGGTERYGNSIVVFEIAKRCSAHLGHLHHRLTREHLDERPQRANARKRRPDGNERADAADNCDYSLVRAHCSLAYSKNDIANGKSPERESEGDEEPQKRVHAELGPWIIDELTHQECRKGT